MLCGASLNLPHARGDEPNIISKNLLICPTHVGMNRIRCEQPVMLNLPHARGDEPLLPEMGGLNVRDLPHANTNSGDEPIVTIPQTIEGMICPTHVGMNPGAMAPQPTGEPSAHARGDEPHRAEMLEIKGYICPRTWG